MVDKEYIADKRKKERKKVRVALHQMVERYSYLE